MGLPIRRADPERGGAGVRFLDTPLPGTLVLEPEPVSDERGLFARTFCRREFALHGLVAEFVQCSTSFNPKRGTLRGMHYQRPPHAEAKLVRCTAGAIFDVMVDLRTGSPTLNQWLGTELTSRNRRMVYAGPGFAHGFLTLEDDTEVFYQISQDYVPEASAGVRWDDPAFGIAWPAGVRIEAISERDRSYPGWRP